MNTTTLTVQEGSAYLGEAELGSSFEDALQSLFACRGDTLSDDLLKDLIVQLHDISDDLDPTFDSF